MPRRSILTARQRAALFELPSDEASLLRHCTLADDDGSGSGEPGPIRIRFSDAKCQAPRKGLSWQPKLLRSNFAQMPLSQDWHLLYACLVEGYWRCGKCTLDSY